MEVSIFYISLVCIAFNLFLNITYIQFRLLTKFFCDYPDGSIQALKDDSKKLFVLPVTMFLVECLAASGYFYAKYKHVNFLVLGVGLPLLIVLYIFTMRLFKENDFDYVSNPQKSRSKKAMIKSLGMFFKEKIEEAGQEQYDGGSKSNW